MTKLWCVVALWGDEAPLTKRDGILLLTYRAMSGSIRQRVWIACVKKSKLCRCGCSGRCTVNAIYDIIAWSAKALLVGKWPALDHEGRGFTRPEDTWRRERAGGPLRHQAAILHYCGDWAWFKQICGVRGWQGDTAAKFICWTCAASLAGEHDAFDCSAEASWRNCMTTMARFWNENEEWIAGSPLPSIALKSPINVLGVVSGDSGVRAPRCLKNIRGPPFEHFWLFLALQEGPPDIF